MSKLGFTILILGVISIVLTNNIDAKIYKWVDEDGATHFSEFPPQDKKIDKVYNTPSSSTEDEKERTNDSEKKANAQEIKDGSGSSRSEVITLSESDIYGKWKHMGTSSNKESNQLSEPYKPQSWEFMASGTVRFTIGDKSNSFPYEVKGNEIITKPYKNETRSFFVEKIAGDKMVWRDPIWKSYVHVTRIY